MSASFSFEYFGGTGSLNEYSVGIFHVPALKPEVSKTFSDLGIAASQLTVMERNRQSVC